MQFTTSCFSPSLWLHFLRRFWPLAAAIFLLLLAYPGILIVGIASDAPSRDYIGTVQAIDVVLHGSAMVMWFASAFPALIATTLLFRHLHQRNELQFYHGLPLSRTALFTSAFLAALTLLVVPGACAMLVHGVYLLAMGYGGVWVLLARNVLCGAVGALLFSAMASFAAVVAGNALGMILIFLALNFTVLVIASGASLPIGLLMPGLGTDFWQNPAVLWLTPVAQLPMCIGRAGVTSSAELALGAVALPETLTLVVYAIAGVCLAVLSCILNHVRRAEAAGETVAFTPARTICKALFALVIAAIGVFVCGLADFFGTKAPAWQVIAVLAVFATLGWFIAEMIVRKSFRVFDSAALKPCCALLVLIIAAAGLAWADPLNIVNRVPANDDVTQAEVTVNGSTIHMDPQDATDLHRFVLENRDIFADSWYNSYGFSVDIRYTLASGSRLVRSYYIDTSSISEGDKGAASVFVRKLDDQLSKPSYALQYHFGPKYSMLSADTLVSAEVTTYGKANSDGEVSTKETSLNKAQSLELLEAVREDAANGRICTLEDDIAGLTSVAEALFEWHATADPDALEHSYIQVTEDMTATRAWIKNH